MTDIGPRDRWGSVPPETQREVERLARRSRAHPDPEVSAAALGWAEVILTAHKADQEDELRGIWRVLSVLHPAEALNDWLHEGAERRWARRVIAAGSGPASTPS